MPKRGRPPTSTINVRVNWCKKIGGFILVWRDPLTRTRHQANADTADRDAAVIQGAELQAKLRQANGGASGSWQQLLDAMEQIYKPSIRPTTWKEYYTTALYWEKIAGAFHDLDKITLEHVRRFHKGLPGEANTKAKHLRHLRAIFNFAKSQGLMVDPPKIKIPAARQGFVGKGTPKSPVEIQAVFDALDDYLGPIRADSWVFLLRGMLNSGLRISEAMALSWDKPPVQLRVEKVRGVEVVTIYLTHQKSGKIEEAPTTREFAELVLSVPPGQRKGRVFNPAGERAESIKHPHAVMHTIRKAMKAASITFTSHDLDRTFADNLSRTKTQQVLSKFTRRTPKVLERYYAKLESQRLSYDEMTGGDGRG